MASKPETNFRKKIRKDLLALQREGAPLFFEAIQQKAIKGSPDFVLCANGHFIALELKSEEGIISAIQAVKMKTVLESGGLALVAYPANWDNVLSTIIFYLTGENDDNCADHKKS